MSVIAIRALLRRHRRELAVVALVVGLCAVLAVHHSAPALADMHHAIGSSDVAQMCLGVGAAVAVGFAVALAALGAIRGARRRLAVRFAPVGVATPEMTLPHGRDGPMLLCLLCVWRR